MNNEFGRTLALLRKQQGLSQKKVAEDLGVSQGLLSHYEKGIRECSLSFLTKTAEYFEVTTDYLLGLTSSPNSVDIKTDYINTSEELGNSVTNTYYLINRKLIIDTTTIIYNILSEIDSKKLNRYVSDYIMTSLYNIFRKIYILNEYNPDDFFNVSHSFENFCDASMKIDLGKINKISSEQKDKMKLELSPEIINREYREISSSLTELIRNTEKNINSKFKT